MNDADPELLEPGEGESVRPPLRVVFREGSQIQRTLLAVLLLVVAVSLGVIVYSAMSGFSNRPLFVGAVFIELAAAASIGGLAMGRRTNR